MIVDVMMVSKVITFLSQMDTFNEYIREWRQQSNNSKICATFNTFFTNPTVNKVEQSKQVLLSPLVDQFTGFRQVSVLTILHNIFNSYMSIEKTDLKENTVKMMEPYFL